MAVSHDVRRLCDFYTRVLEMAADGAGTFTSLETIGASLSLFTEDGTERMAPGSMEGAGRGAYTIEFEVEDVDTEHRRLQSLNIPVVKVPTTQSWGRRPVWFRDPDGNIVNFYTSVLPTS